MIRKLKSYLYIESRFLKFFKKSVGKIKRIGIFFKTIK